jgi:hypothetical protein
VVANKPFWVKDGGIEIPDQYDTGFLTDFLPCAHFGVPPPSVSAT